MHERDVVITCSWLFMASDHREGRGGVVSLGSGGKENNLLELQVYCAHCVVSLALSLSFFLCFSLHVYHLFQVFLIPDRIFHLANTLYGHSFSGLEKLNKTIN